MADGAAMNPAERAKLEQRRDRLMKLLNDANAGRESLDADDRADLEQEWAKLDRLLQSTR